MNEEDAYVKLAVYIDGEHLDSVWVKENDTLQIDVEAESEKSIT